MKPTLLDAKWAKEIRQEHQRLLADEDVLHNREIHQQILATWERDSPQMWERLGKLGIRDALAFVCQERMWQAEEAYRKGGLPMTDAREQAERDHLMLEPEPPEVDDSDLPDDLQDAPRNLKERWREVMRRMNGED